MLPKIGSVIAFRLNALPHVKQSGLCFFAFYDLAFVVHTNPKLVPDTAFCVSLFDDSGSGDIKHVDRHFFHLRASSRIVLCACAIIVGKHD